MGALSSSVNPRRRFTTATGTPRITRRDRHRQRERLVVNPTLSWDIAADVRHLFDYAFMVNALEAGTIVAVMASVIGWFMVLRRQTFAGHTLSVMAFPGASGAALAGLPIAVGYYVACTLAAVALGPAQRRDASSQGSESAAIGTVQACGLALGFLFLSLYKGVLGGLETLLFGTFLGISTGQVLTLLIVAGAVVLTLAIAGRPLLFATVDPAVARASGVPVRALSIGFLVLLGLAVAATSQITGALLVFALLVTPAATAQLITARPGLSLGLSVLFALATTWLGLGISYYSPYPVGFYITSVAFALYAAARLARALAGQARTRRRTGRVHTVGA
jgi:zinc/manganese transport system permease protein